MCLFCDNSISLFLSLTVCLCPSIFKFKYFWVRKTVHHLYKSQSSVYVCLFLVTQFSLCVCFCRCSNIQCYTTSWLLLLCHILNSDDNSLHFSSTTVPFCSIPQVYAANGPCDSGVISCTICSSLPSPSANYAKARITHSAQFCSVLPVLHSHYQHHYYKHKKLTWILI